MLEALQRARSDARLRQAEHLGAEELEDFSPCTDRSEKPVAAAHAKNEIKEEAALEPAPQVASSAASSFAAGSNAQTPMERLAAIRARVQQSEYRH